MTNEHEASVNEVYKAVNQIVVPKAREHVAAHPLGPRTRLTIELILGDYIMEVPEELILKLCAVNLSMVEAAMDAKEQDE